MKHLTVGLVSLLALYGCSTGSAPTAPVAAKTAPAAVYQHTASKIDPSLSAEELYLAGVGHLREERAMEAVAHLEEALRRAPDHPQTAYQLGAAYERTGRLADAKQVYQEALIRSPQNLDLRRAAAALAGDFTMDGVPDRIEIRGPFLYFFDGATDQRLLTLQPRQGETNLKVEMLDLGGPVPAILISSPQGVSVEVFRGDGFTGAIAGQSALYDAARRQLIVQRPLQISPDPAPPVGYVRFRQEGGQPAIDLRSVPHTP